MAHLAHLGASIVILQETPLFGVLFLPNKKPFIDQGVIAALVHKHAKHHCGAL